MAGTLYVDTAYDMGKVSQLAYGTNHGPWAFLNPDVSPQYYPYQMYKGFGDELVFATADAPMLSIYAARKGDRLTLVIVNLNDQAITRPLVLDHFTPGSPAQVRLLDEQHKAASQPDVTLTGKSDYTVLPLSMTLLTIPGDVTPP